MQIDLEALVQNPRIIIVVAGAIVLSLLVMLLKTKRHCQWYKKKYAPVISLETEVETLKQELAAAQRKHERYLFTVECEKAKLIQDYESARQTYSALRKEVDLIEENIDDISFGLYKPHFNFETSEAYKAKLQELRDKERDMIRTGAAATCTVQWSISGSTKDGAKLAKQNSKLFLRAFNGECDAALAKVSWNNITKMEERIRRAWEAINQLGTVLQISIMQPYLNLKVDELRLTFEYEEKHHEEQEEQRRLREQMREEERVQREIEKAREEAEREELRYERALEKARIEASLLGSS